jgi:L-sorbose 1-phosphate reductase
LETAAEAIESVIEGKYSGKVVIFPQIHNLPLMGLKERPPEVAAKLGEVLIW